MIWLSALLAAQTAIPQPAVADAPSEEAAKLQLIDIEGLATAEAGDLILAGHAHGDIVDIWDPRGFGPPGVVRLALAESPVRIGNGCHRRLWTATFYVPMTGFRAEPGLQAVRSVEQVSLAGDRPCELAAYAGLGGDMSPERGIEYLEILQGIGDGSRKARFACSNATDTRLCLTDNTIRYGLRADSLRGVSITSIGERDGQASASLRGPGSLLTTVKFGTDPTDTVTVERSIPPPF